MRAWLRELFSGKSTAETTYLARVETALSDAFLNDAEWAGLKEEAARLGLSEEKARTIYMTSASGIIEDRVLEALEDGQLSPDEETDLEFLARDLRLDLTFAPDTQAIVNRAKLAWRLAHEPLPTVPSPLGLQRSEHAHIWVTAEAFEERERTKAVSFAGPTVSIPIMKGVRYRMGRYNVGRETYRFQHSFGPGTLVITNKRLIFVGERSLTCKLTNILDVEGYSDGVKVTRTTGKPHTFVYGQTNQHLATVLARAWSEARL